MCVYVWCVRLRAFERECQARVQVCVYKYQITAVKRTNGNPHVISLDYNAKGHSEKQHHHRLRKQSLKEKKNIKRYENILSDTHTHTLTHAHSHSHLAAANLEL